MILASVRYHTSDALIGFAAAHEEQSPHVEYHFTVNYMINEGALLYSQQVAVRAKAEMTSSCGGALMPRHQDTTALYSTGFLFLNV